MKSSSILAAAALALLSLCPVLRASREGSESSASSEAHLNKQAHELHKRLVQCQGIQEDQTAEKDNQKSVKKLEECINAISQLAENTKSQRAKSMEANKNYASDLVLAKKILRYLTKKTDDEEVAFNDYKSGQEEHLKEVEEMLQTVQQPSGPTAASLMQNSPASLLSVQSRQAPVMSYQAMPQAQMPPQAWGGMAAMFSPTG